MPLTHLSSNYCMIYMADETAVAVVGFGIMAIRQVLKKKLKRSRWCKNVLRNCDQFSHLSLLHELQKKNLDGFHNYQWMTDNCFYLLLAAVTPYIDKNFRLTQDAISPKQRLIVTLGYLATSTVEAFKISGISLQALGVIISKTCSAIIKVLQKFYINIRYISLNLQINIFGK